MEAEKKKERKMGWGGRKKNELRGNRNDGRRQERACRGVKECGGGQKGG